MSRQPLDWSALQLLVAVHEAGSMLAAARRLGLAASTVGRRLSALERSLDVTLLDRGPQGIRLTPAGAALARCGVDVDLSIAQALRDLPRPGRGLTGTIRISAGDGFADVLVDAVRVMTRHHPEVRFELALEDRTVDLPRREADVALRTVNQQEGTLIYRKVGALRYGLFAHAEYLEEHAPIASEADLAGHSWVGLASPLDRLPANRWLAERAGGAPVLAGSTFQAMHAAARAGLGLAALPLSTAPLSRVLPECALPELPLWLVIHRDARDLPHVAAFVSVLREQLEARLAG